MPVADAYQRAASRRAVQVDENRGDFPIFLFLLAIRKASAAVTGLDS